MIFYLHLLAMDSDKYFEVLFNDCIGGYGLPEIVLKEFFECKKEKGEIKCNTCLEIKKFCVKNGCTVDIECCNDSKSRTDPDLIAICKKHFDKCNDLCVEGEFDIAYKECVTIHDAVGKETITLDLEKFYKNVAKKSLPFIKTTLPQPRRNGIKKTLILYNNEIIVEPRWKVTIVIYTTFIKNLANNTLTEDDKLYEDGSYMHSEMRTYTIEMSSECKEPNVTAHIPFNKDWIYKWKLQITDYAVQDYNSTYNLCKADFIQWLKLFSEEEKEFKHSVFTVKICKDCFQFEHREDSVNYVICIPRDIFCKMITPINNILKEMYNL